MKKNLSDLHFIYSQRCWHRNRYDQWNRIEAPTQSHTAIPIRFLTKEPKTYVGGKIPSSSNGAGKTGYSPAEY
jgi:hypothetical protein